MRWGVVAGTVRARGCMGRADNMADVEERWWSLGAG